jgi:K+-transporting ATPase c subunit
MSREIFNFLSFGSSRVSFSRLRSSSFAHLADNSDGSRRLRKDEQKLLRQPVRKNRLQIDLVVSSGAGRREVFCLAAAILLDRLADFRQESLVTEKSTLFYPPQWQDQ